MGEKVVSTSYSSAILGLPLHFIDFEFLKKDFEFALLYTNEGIEYQRLLRYTLWDTQIIGYKIRAETQELLIQRLIIFHKLLAVRLPQDFALKVRVCTASSLGGSARSGL